MAVRILSNNADRYGQKILKIFKARGDEDGDGDARQIPMFEKIGKNIKCPLHLTVTYVVHSACLLIKGQK